ncbi:deoxyuridine 5'-triphosphate nucleotidohydrolase, mitochondrial isoform X2 [Saccopteryx bilineata]|uniref:deoxyuridine 5'-triphosphate nucleotidohydrolase, mitochondrial isoform X2 n=1 Tax=Saccopteryx bilineata TaxID=59482 RepID=UPI00338DF9C4
MRTAGRRRQPNPGQSARPRPSPDGGGYCFRGRFPRRVPRLQARGVLAGAAQPTGARSSGQMTFLCPRLVLGYHFLPFLLRSAFKDARSSLSVAETAGLRRAGPAPSAVPAPSVTALPGTSRPLSSARSRSRRCRGTETPAVSPSKRLRAAEDGGLRLRFVRLSEHATAPTKGSARAAGYDLYSAYDYTVPPMEKTLVKTDIQIALPAGCYGRVAPRSGLAAKHFIDVGAGVIDEDYRGNIGVVLFNFGKEEFEVKKGDRIAQLICERIFYPEIEEVQMQSPDSNARHFFSIKPYLNLVFSCILGSPGLEILFK